MTDLDCLPYGVGHSDADEGICLLMRMGPYRILLDCGLWDIRPLKGNGDSPAIDLVLCSHAHADHARGLRSLHRAFPELPIYASEVTAALLPLNWLDDGKLPSERFCQPLPWREPLEVKEGLWVELFPAGHLPGASIARLTYASGNSTYTVVYTGDFLLSNSRLVEGLPLEELRGLAPDVLIAEGSYGTARYPRRRTQENQLAERIYRAICDRQSVLLPVPTLGLGQELLMLLRSHHHFTGRDLDIWVNGSVAIGCDTYLKLLPNFPSTVQNFARHQALFWDERVCPRVRRLTPQQRATVGKSPCIILTDETTDVSQFCRPDSGHWLVLLQEHPGYPLRNEELAFRYEHSVGTSQLQVETYLLGEHCDGSGTTQLIHNLRPHHVIFVHGTPAYLADLTNLEELRNRYKLHYPATGKLVELPIGEQFLQPEMPEASYEGELTEEDSGVTIAFSKTITTDPRWQNFADTGLVEARWQGDELVMRGVSQRELLDRTGERPIPPELECCANCIHYRGQRCWNQSSPLYGFKVTPDGYCPVFEAIDKTKRDREE